MLGDYALEQANTERARRRGRVALRFEELDARALQAVRLDLPLEDAKALLAAGRDMEEAELRHFPLADLCQRANLVRRRRGADLGTLANGADAERLVVAQAGLQHVDIALLEDAQRQPPAGKKHRVQRKERELVYGSASSASARWRTSTRQSPRKALASSSAK